MSSCEMCGAVYTRNKKKKLAEYGTIGCRSWNESTKDQEDRSGGKGGSVERPKVEGREILTIQLPTDCRSVDTMNPHSLRCLLTLFFLFVADQTAVEAAAVGKGAVAGGGGRGIKGKAAESNPDRGS